MKFLVFGTSEFTLRTARALVEAGTELCGFVSLPRAHLPDNSVALRPFAEEQDAPYYEFESLDDPACVEMVRASGAEYVLSSWPKILGKEIPSAPKKCVIGTHPTPLPWNRGRHPLHWMIVMGITSSRLSFFRMDEGVDTGRVLLQVPYQIPAGSTISDAVEAMNVAAEEGVGLLVEKLRAVPDFGGQEQEHSEANYWRKRGRHDVILDPRMSAAALVRTVKSFTEPYPCARLIYRKRVIPVVDAVLLPAEEGQERMEPGKIIRREETRVCLKAYDALVEFTCAETLPKGIRPGKYIQPPSHYFSRWAEELNAQLQ